MNSTIGRLRLALAMVATVLIVGTLGYWAFGFTLLDAAYQTVMTVSTVGFREVEEFGNGEKLFTMVLIVTGASTVLYTFTLAVQVVVEGQLREFVGRRRMDREIANSADTPWSAVGAGLAALSPTTSRLLATAWW